MLTVILGVVGAFVYGAADFFGGLAARRLGALTATAIAETSGVVLLLIAMPFFGGVWSGAAIGWGLSAGVVGAVAVWLLYACLAVGPMSILSPLTAVVSAIVPMIVGLAQGESFGPLGYWALGLALVAVVLVGFVPEKGAVRPSAKGLIMAVASGLAIGAFLIILDRAPTDSGLIPLLFTRAAAGVVLFAAVGALAWRAARRPVPAGVQVGGTADAMASAARRTGITLATVGGFIDASANVLLLVGLRVGDLSVMSVLTALYPAGTIILAAIVLKERIAPVQWAGLVLALAAAGMLAAA